MGSRLPKISPLVDIVKPCIRPSRFYTNIAYGMCTRHVNGTHSVGYSIENCPLFNQVLYLLV